MRAGVGLARGGPVGPAGRRPVAGNVAVGCTVARALAPRPPRVSSEAVAPAGSTVDTPSSVGEPFSRRARRQWRSTLICERNGRRCSRDVPRCGASSENRLVKAVFGRVGSSSRPLVEAVIVQVGAPHALPAYFQEPTTPKIKAGNRLRAETPLARAPGSEPDLPADALPDVVERLASRRQFRPDDAMC